MTMAADPRVTLHKNIAMGNKPTSVYGGKNTRPFDSIVKTDTGTKNYGGGNTKPLDKINKTSTSTAGYRPDHISKKAAVTRSGQRSREK